MSGKRIFVVTERRISWDRKKGRDAHPHWTTKQIHDSVMALLNDVGHDMLTLTERSRRRLTASTQKQCPSKLGKFLVSRITSEKHAP